MSPAPTKTTLPDEAVGVLVGVWVGLTAAVGVRVGVWVEPAEVGVRVAVGAVPPPVWITS